MTSHRIGHSAKRAHSSGGSTRPVRCLWEVAQPSSAFESFGGSSGSKSPAKRAAGAKGKIPTSSFIMQTRNAINALVEEPLKVLRASILHAGGHPRGKVVALSTLCPMMDLLDAMLSVLHEFSNLLSSDNMLGSKASILQLLEGQQKLIQYAHFAGKSLCSLAAEAGPQGVGTRLRLLQENLTETLDGVRFQWQREDARRHEKSSETEARLKEEISELRMDLCEERGRSEGLLEQGFSERRRWYQEVEECTQNSIVERQSIDKHHWDSLFSEVSHLTQHADGARRLAEVYESQVAQRDRELRAVRERADATVTEMHCAEDGAQAQRAFYSAELQQVQGARERTLRELREEHGCCEALMGTIARSEKLEEQISGGFVAELEHERRERSSLSLQLSEALETISSRDLAIEGLRRSLCDQLERARQPPIAASVPGQSNDGQLDPTANFLAHRRPGSNSSPPRAMSIPPFPKVPATPDGPSSVCRISTDSAKFASRAALDQPTHAYDQSSIGAGRHIYASRSGSLLETTLANTQGDESSTKATEVPIEKLRPPRGPTNEHIGSIENVERPWELSPKEFLAQWRRSRTSICPGSYSTTAPASPQRSVSHIHDVNVPLSAETLRITASFQ